MARQTRPSPLAITTPTSSHALSSRATSARSAAVLENSSTPTSSTPSSDSAACSDACSDPAPPPGDSLPEVGGGGGGGGSRSLRRPPCVRSTAPGGLFSLRGGRFGTRSSWVAKESSRTMDCHLTPGTTLAAGQETRSLGHFAAAGQAGQLGQLGQASGLVSALLSFSFSHRHTHSLSWQPNRTAVLRHSFAASASRASQPAILEGGESWTSAPQWCIPTMKPRYAETHDTSSQPSTQDTTTS
mmetsp:Transcript_66855/g.151032  ORF Transcript_66855/g.151032 Transcript_66855/m.151032 type:complete len:243 (+) Transcript_66855:649-1377(+)